MGTSVLHIKTEVECRVYLFDEEKGIAKPGTYFNLEVHKGEQDLLFVGTEDKVLYLRPQYNVKEEGTEYQLTLETSQFKSILTEATDEELANGVEDEYGVVYSADATQLLKAEKDDLKEYQVKEGCKVIRNGAFNHKHLTGITLPSTVTHIGTGAFRICEYLTDITMLSGLTYIGNGAFMHCNSLVRITLPPTLTYLGVSAFFNCESLAEITLSTSLTHIGILAFAYCKNLTNITLPTSLTHIGRGAFLGTTIRTVVNNSPQFLFDGGCLIDVEAKKLVAFLSDKNSVVLPKGLTYIENVAFCDCKDLTTITLPDSLTHIGKGAFSGCENLTNLLLPEGLTYIGDGAFCGCVNLTSINMPASLTHIGEKAFPVSTKLKYSRI